MSDQVYILSSTITKGSRVSLLFVLAFLTCCIVHGFRKEYSLTMLLLFQETHFLHFISQLHTEGKIAKDHKELQALFSVFPSASSHLI